MIQTQTGINWEYIFFQPKSKSQLWVAAVTFVSERSPPFIAFFLINAFRNQPKRQSQYLFNLLSSVQSTCVTAHTHTHARSLLNANPIWNARTQALITHHIKSSAHPVPAVAGSVRSAWVHSKHWPRTSHGEDSVNDDRRDRAGYIWAPLGSDRSSPEVAGSPASHKSLWWLIVRLTADFCFWMWLQRQRCC